RDAVDAFDSPLDPYSLGHQKYDAYSFALNHIHTFNPNTLLNASLGYITNPVRSGRGVLSDYYPDYDISKELGVPEYLKRSGALAAPAILLGNYRSGPTGQNLGSLFWSQYKQTPETYHLLASLSRVQGRHDLKVGWEGRLHKLSLNLGLRYDLSLNRTERHNRMQYLDPNVASPLQVPGLPNLRGGMRFASAEDRTVTGADYNDFGPRFGFAYRFTEKTVLRGGFGVYYTPPRNAALGASGGGFQGFAQVTNWFTSYQNDGATPWGRLSDPWPVTGPNLPIGS